ncbi:beta-galactosidase small subunit, partial [Prevotella sp.]
TAKVKVSDNVKAGEVSFTSKDFEIVFSRQTGLLTRYEVEGRNLLGEGGTLKPNFWRAVTDNDMGANFQNKLAVWHNPKMDLKQVSVEPATRQLTAVYDMPDVAATLHLIYNVAQDGALHVSMEMQMKDGSKAPILPRFGVLMQLPYDMDQSTYYGRGPIENYSDRKYSQRIGLYEQSADQQFFPYIRPQETGTKSDIRWWKQTDNDKFGFKVYFDEAPFYASALHYNISDLDEGKEKHQRHSYQVPTSEYTNLTLDGYMMGVGGINSWGEEPLPQYQLPAVNRAIHFWIQPCK